MALLGYISQKLREKHAFRFEDAVLNPELEQNRKLLDIINKQKNTKFGKDHNFSEIKSVKKFQENVPIQKYSDLKPYVDKMISGEKNILTFEDPLCFGMTGGSEGEPKLTPITETYKNEYQEVLHTFLYYMYRDHPKAFSGKILYFNGSGDMGQSKTGVPYGQMSGFNFKNLPKILQKFYVVPYEITIINDFNAKYYSIALLSLPQNISMMMGVTGGPIIMFMNTLFNNIDSLIKDLYDGTVSKDINLSKSEREIVQKLHKKNPKLAKLIEKSIYKNNGKLNQFDIWPNIDLLVCWKSSTAGSYVNKLNDLFQNKVPIRDAIYSATEGWCNVPYSDDVIGGPLAINAHFYEFIDIDDKEEKVVLTHQLKVGNRYKVLYTTNSGVYRYDIGDILEVTEMYKNTPCIKFYGKTSRVSSIAGEKLSEFHITQAIKDIEIKHSIRIPFYSAVPELKTSPPGYNLLLEISENMNTEKIIELGKDIDENIKHQNWEYKLHRNNGNLSNFKIQLLAKDSSETFRESEVKRLGNDSQVKPLILAEDMSKLANLKIINEIKL